MPGEAGAVGKTKKANGRFLFVRAQVQRYRVLPLDYSLGTTYQRAADSGWLRCSASVKGAGKKFSFRRISAPFQTHLAPREH